MSPLQYKLHLIAPDQSMHRDPVAAITTRCGRVWRRLREAGKPPVHLADGFEQATCRHCLHSYSVEWLGPQRHPANLARLEETAPHLPVNEDYERRLTPQQSELLRAISRRLGGVRELHGSSHLGEFMNALTYRLGNGPPVNQYDLEMIRLVCHVYGLEP